MSLTVHLALVFTFLLLWPSWSWSVAIMVVAVVVCGSHGIGPWSLLTDAEENRAGLEEMTLLLTVAVFLVSCPAEVVLPSSLLTPCVNIFSKSWESSQIQV